MPPQHGRSHWMHRKPGLIRRGAQANGAKLCPRDDEMIRQLTADGWTNGQIAGHLGVSRVTIWRHRKAMDVTSET
jgi:FixJ family two-component response regulator